MENKLHFWVAKKIVFNFNYEIYELSFNAVIPNMNFHGNFYSQKLNRQLFCASNVYVKFITFKLLLNFALARSI